MANYKFDALRYCRNNQGRLQLPDGSDPMERIAEELRLAMELREAVRAERRLEKRLESECWDETEWKTAYCQLQHARAEVDRLLREPPC